MLSHLFFHELLRFAIGERLQWRCLVFACSIFFCHNFFNCCNTEERFRTALWLDPFHLQEELGCNLLHGLNVYTFLHFLSHVAGLAQPGRTCSIIGRVNRWVSLIHFWQSIAEWVPTAHIFAWTGPLWHLILDVPITRPLLTTQPILFWSFRGRSLEVCLASCFLMPLLIVWGVQISLNNTFMEFTDACARSICRANRHQTCSLALLFSKVELGYSPFSILL